MTKTPRRDDRIPLPGEDDAPSVLGRDSKCERVLNSPVVSRRHFALFSRRGGFLVRGLGAGAELYVNGRPVQKHELNAGDRIRVGPFLFTFDGTEFATTNELGKMQLEARGIGKSIGKTEILRDVSLTVLPGEFIGVLGPSGAGKTTLLGCLNGLLTPSTGGVSINGEDLAFSFESLKTNFGTVPQDDIIHLDLTVRDALMFAARLRLAPDTTRAERNSLVDGVLQSIELVHRQHARIRTLSGGERKRVNLAVELTTRPSLLFLDEPTSGLDPAAERKLMKLFRRLANEGRTVILTTHIMENIELFDRIVVLVEGRLAFFGPPAEAITTFGIQRMTELYDLLETREPDEWAAIYRDSDAYRQNVVEHRGAGLETYRDLASLATRPARWRSPLRALSQVTVLFHRSLAAVFGDPLSIAALLLPGPLVGFLATVPLDSTDPDDRYKLLFLLTITAIFCGCFNSFREIVKERAIFQRERMVNLMIIPYVLSKLFLHASFLAIECALLLAVVVLVEDVGGIVGLQYAALFTAALASAALGLLISSLVKTSEKAIGLVILACLPQIIFSGGIATLTGNSATVGKFTVAFWCFDGVLEIANGLGRGLGEMGMIAAHAGVYLLLTTLALRILEKR